MNNKSFKLQLQSTRLYYSKPSVMDYREWRNLVTIGYVGIVGDLFHAGHLNILQIANVYCKIVVAGVLTDEAAITYKREPIFSFEERCRIIKNLEYVDIVIPQETLSYKDNLKLVEPTHLFHGKDWINGVQRSTREEALRVLEEFSGTLIEPERYEGISTTEIIEQIQSNQ